MTGSPLSWPTRCPRMRRGEDLRVADVIRERAAERGDATAIVHGTRELSYARLDERSSRLAQALRASGVGPGDRVAYLDRSAPEVVELLFAVSKLGAVIVPMNWRLAVPEPAAVLSDSRAPVLIAGAGFSGVAAELARQLPASPRPESSPPAEPP